MLTVTNPSPTSVTSPPTHSTKCTRPLDDDDPTPITIPGSDPLDSPSIHTLSCFHQSKLLLKFPDRKSTRLNSSHQIISYAVFCLKIKKKTMNSISPNP